MSQHFHGLYNVLVYGVPFSLQRRNYRQDSIRIVKYPNYNNANRFHGLITKTFPENDRFVIDDIIKVTTVDQSTVTNNIDELVKTRTKLGIFTGAVAIVTTGSTAFLYACNYPLLSLAPALSGIGFLYIGIKRFKETNLEIKNWRQSLINRFIERRVRCQNMNSYTVYKKNIVNRYMLPIEGQNIWKREYTDIKIKVENFDHMSLEKKTELLDDVFGDKSIFERNMTDYLTIFNTEQREHFYKSYQNSKFIFTNIRSKYDNIIKQLYKSKNEYREHMKKDFSSLQNMLNTKSITEHKNNPDELEKSLVANIPISATYANKYAQLYADINHEYDKQIANEKERESEELIKLIPLIREIINFIS